jgi:hypothetical protein
LREAAASLLRLGRKDPKAASSEFREDRVDLPKAKGK